MEEAKAVFNIYDDYKEKFNAYYARKTQIVAYSNALKNKEKAQEENIKAVEQVKNDLQNAEMNLSRCEQKKKREEKDYPAKIVRRVDYIDKSVEEYEKKLRDNVYEPNLSFGELTNNDIYRTYLKKESDKFELSKQKYKSKRTEELDKNIKNHEKDLDLFVTCPAAATDKTIASTWGSDAVMKKAENVHAYLNANIKIRNSESGRRIREAIDKGKIDISTCGGSAYEMTRRLSALPDTSNYATKNIKDLEAAKAYVRENSFTSSALAILLAILMFVGFIYVFPLSNVLPHIFNTDGWWWIFGWLAWLLGAGRFIVVWILQLLICFLVWVLAETLFTETSLAKLFYWPADRVLEDISSFEKIFQANEQGYIHLMHYKEAVEAVEKWRLETELKAAKKSLSRIEEEEGFKKIISDYNLAIAELQDRRNQQLIDKNRKISKAKAQAEYTERDIVNKVHDMRQRLNEEEDKRVKDVKNSLAKAKSDIDDANKTITQYNEKLRKAAKKAYAGKSEILQMEKELNDYILDRDELKKTLLSYTELIRKPDYLVRHAFELATPEGLAAVDGILNNSLYFISNKLNEDGLLTFTDIPFVNRPTVFFYDRKELKSSNLSNELAGFIGLLGDTVMRVNPLPLFFERKFDIVDTVTGAEIFRDNKTYPQFNVISTAQEIRSFTDSLKRQMDLIRMACEELYVNTSIKAANIGKAEINRNSNPKPRSVEEMQEQYCTYTVAIFIMPNESKGHLATDQIINEDMKRYFQNCELYGFSPIFLVDYDTWSNEDPSGSIEYLHKVCLTKDFRFISGIGPNQDIRISLQPQRG